MTLDDVPKLIAALREARRLNNQTVRKSREIEAWHRETDRLLETLDPEDDPQERFEDPERVDARRRLNEYYGRSGA